MVVGNKSTLDTASAYNSHRWNWSTNINKPKQMKRLVIHPTDESTDFLAPIYNRLPDVTLVTTGYSRLEIMELIDEHDQVIMLGHGTPGGLLNVSGFRAGMYIVDAMVADSLIRKDNSIFIWCNADQFVRRYNLKGMYSGMFISEVAEASYFKIYTDQNTVDRSNDMFAQLLGERLLVSDALEDIHASVGQQYQLLAETNDIARYNSDRWYISR